MMNDGIRTIHSDQDAIQYSLEWVLKNIETDHISEWDCLSESLSFLDSRITRQFHGCGDKIKREWVHRVDSQIGPSFGRSIADWI